MPLKCGKKVAFLEEKRERRKGPQRGGTLFEKLFVSNAEKGYADALGNDSGKKPQQETEYRKF